MGEQPKSLISDTPFDTISSIIKSEDPKTALLAVITELKAATANNPDQFMVAANEKLEKAQIEIEALEKDDCKKAAKKASNFIGGITIHGIDGIIPRLKSLDVSQDKYEDVITKTFDAIFKPKNHGTAVKVLENQHPVVREAINVSILSVAIAKKSTPKVAAAPEKPTCALSPEIQAAVERALNSEAQLSLTFSLLRKAAKSW